jgi:hypothetical protein
MKADPDETDPDDLHSILGYKIHGDVASFVLALGHARGRLEERLRRLDPWDYIEAGTDEEAWVAIGDATAASLVIKALRRELPIGDRDSIPESHVEPVDNWVANALYPRWRRARDWLSRHGVPRVTPDLDFRQFLAAYFQIMVDLLGEDHRAAGSGRSLGIRIPQPVWDIVSPAASDLRLTAMPFRSYRTSAPPKVMLSGPFSDSSILLTRGAERLLSALGKLSPRSATTPGAVSPSKWLIEASTYGIFAPAGADDVDARLAEWAVRNHALPQATLPGWARVLLCTRQLAALGAEPSADGSGPGLEPPDRRLLTRCVVIHEHFHAIVETGIDPDGEPPLGPRDRDAWSSATRLNESVAAWMEWHYLDRLAALPGAGPEVVTAKLAVEAYVRSGPYPQWPYRGAERVEALFRRGGIDAVRDLIHRLRTTPAAAQQGFDEVV